MQCCNTLKEENLQGSVFHLIYDLWIYLCGGNVTAMQMTAKPV